MKLEVVQHCQVFYINNKSTFMNHCNCFSILHNNYMATGGPTIIEYPRDQTLHITIGSEEVKLTCQASGSDLIGGYWERLNGDPIPKENNISIIHMDLDNTMMQLNMTIVGARPVHLGLYHCVVYSRWGITESIPTQVNITG